MELYNRSVELGADLPEAIELLTGAARPILERWFEAEVLRATLATDAIIGAFASPSLSRHGVRAAASRDGRSGRRSAACGATCKAAWAALRPRWQVRAAIWASKSAARRR